MSTGAGLHGKSGGAPTTENLSVALSPPIPIWVLVVLIGFPQLSETIFAPILPALSAHYHVSENLSQATLSVYFLGFAFGVFFWGILADRWGRKPCMIAGLLCYTIFSALLWVSPTIWVLLGVRVLQAFGAAAGSVITQTMMRDCFTTPYERVKVFSIISQALAFAPATGPLLGGYLAEIFSFQAVFAFLIVMGVGLTWVSRAFLPETLPVQLHQMEFHLWPICKRVLQDGQIWVYVLLVAGLNCMIFSCYGESPFVFMETLHLSKMQYGWFGLTVGAGCFVAAKFSKGLAERHKAPDFIIRLGLQLTIASALLYLVPSLLHFELWSRYAKVIWLMGTSGLVFVGIVMTLPSIFSQALIAYQDCLGRAGAVFGALYYAVLSLMMAMVNLIHSPSVWTFGLIVLGISSGLWFVLFLRKAVEKKMV